MGREAKWECADADRAVPLARGFWGESHLARGERIAASRVAMSEVSGTASGRAVSLAIATPLHADEGVPDADPEQVRRQAPTRAAMSSFSTCGLCVRHVPMPDTFGSRLPRQQNTSTSRACSHQMRARAFGVNRRQIVLQRARAASHSSR
jgi:hypothetical protein